MPSAESFVLDTHVWLEMAFGRERGFSARLRRRLEAAAERSALYVAAITPWEVATLVRRGRVRVAGPVLDFVVSALRETRTAVATLQPEVAVDAVELPAWEHRDPADRTIVASARQLNAFLVTRDSAILEYASTIKAVRAVDPAA